MKAADGKPPRINLSSWFALSIIILFFCSPALSVENTGSIRVKTLYVFIGAVVDRVVFENIGVFERQDSKGPWQVNIALPDGSTITSLDEPNQIQLEQGGKRISKNMPADSLVDSVGFSFSLPNERGNCQTQIKCDYPIDSMAVHLSGPASMLTSDILKSNDFMAARSRFSSVYTANNLPAGSGVMINLSKLPQRDANILEFTAAGALGLIVIVALLTMYSRRTKIKAGSDDNEACPEQPDLS